MNVSVIIDADSMIYASAYSETLSEAKSKLDENINLTLNEIEDLGYSVGEFIICSGSYGNFRKFISNTYKSNRTQEKPKFLKELHKYCRVNWHSKYVLGVETDDVVASYWEGISSEGLTPIIATIDKDYLQFPAKIYNYLKKTLVDVDEISAYRNFYTQMLVGDSADNVKGVVGVGKAKAKTILDGLTSNYSMRRAVYESYKNYYKGKASLKYRENYSLLKLRTDVV